MPGDGDAARCRSPGISSVVPVALAVEVPELPAGAVHDDERVAVTGVVVVPGRVLGAEVDAAVGDVAHALIGDGPGGGVDEDAVVAQAHAVVDHRVVAAGVAGQSPGRGVHVDFA